MILKGYVSLIFIHQDIDNKKLPKRLIFDNYFGIKLKKFHKKEGINALHNTICFLGFI